MAPACLVDGVLVGAGDLGETDLHIPSQALVFYLAAGLFFAARMMCFFMLPYADVIAIFVQQSIYLLIEAVGFVASAHS